MSPLDRSPHGEEILHELPEAPFPQPLQGGDEKPEEKPEEKPREKPDHGPHGGAPEPDVEHRPPIPTHTELQAVDVEDEEADPVVESGPGVDEPEGRVHRLARELGLLRG